MNTTERIRIDFYGSAGWHWSVRICETAADGWADTREDVDTAVLAAIRNAR